jgi:organic radical activating enzyme
MPLLQQDRLDMLNNIPVKSCESSCWKPERNNLLSRRLTMQSTDRTHTDINATPMDININLGSICNLTCSYCCKQYSSAWTRDIQENGPYLDTDRFKLTAHNIIVSNISQKEQLNSAGFELLVEELSKFTNLNQVIISGGEPFLYNGVADLLNRVTDCCNIIIYSGLGVDPARFNKQLAKIKNKKQIKLRISAENIGQAYEFNRYGNSYTKFEENVKSLILNGFNIEFAATLSNLTIFGLLEFVKKFKDYKIHYQFCNDPEFLNINVQDNNTKQMLIEQIAHSDILIKNEIINVVEQPCTEQQRQDLSVYLKEFANRRKLSLDIFPASMLQWLKL